MRKHTHASVHFLPRFAAVTAYVLSGKNRIFVFGGLIAHRCVKPHFIIRFGIVGLLYLKFINSVLRTAAAFAKYKMTCLVGSGICKNSQNIITAYHISASALSAPYGILQKSVIPRHSSVRTRCAVIIDKRCKPQIRVIYVSCGTAHCHTVVSVVRPSQSLAAVR